MNRGGLRGAFPSLPDVSRLFILIFYVLGRLGGDFQATRVAVEGSRHTAPPTGSDPKHGDRAGAVAIERSDLDAGAVVLTTESALDLRSGRSHASQEQDSGVSLRSLRSGDDLGVERLQGGHGVVHRQRARGDLTEESSAAGVHVDGLDSGGDIGVPSKEGDGATDQSVCVLVSSDRGDGSSEVQDEEVSHGRTPEYQGGSIEPGEGVERVYLPLTPIM